ncbi:hypothetical protein D3C72_2368100 [compost metagenome]
MTDKEHHPVLPSARAVELAPGQKAHLLEHPGRRTICWADARVGYAMVGELTEAELLKVARSTGSND